MQDAIRRLSHDVSPEIASKSLQALEDRKEEIISELEDIVGKYYMGEYLPRDLLRDTVKVLCT